MIQPKLLALRKKIVEKRKNASLYGRTGALIIREELFQPHGGSLDLMRLTREIKESKLSGERKHLLLNAIEKQLERNIARAKVYARAHA
jgi:hypothetical protein